MHHSTLRRFWLVTPAVLAALPLILGGSPLRAGYMLDHPGSILQPPVFDFLVELCKVPAEGITPAQAGLPADTVELEMAEVVELMRHRLPDPRQRAAWLLLYVEMRTAMTWSTGGKSSKTTFAETRQILGRLEEICAPLPGDMQLYLKGAALFAQFVQTQDAALLQQARDLWRQVVAAPAEQRCWRRTWAAWMLFRTTETGLKEERGRWLMETIRLARAGDPDCLHLGIEAAYILGRPTMSDLPGKETVTVVEWRRAAHLRVLLGHDRAVDDLRNDRAEHMRWSADLARDLLADPFLRRVQLVHLVQEASRSANWHYGARDAQKTVSETDLNLWLDSLEKAGFQNAQEAGLMALAYYRLARFDDARRWSALTQADDLCALSLRAKLVARDGLREETLQWLQHAEKLLPAEPQPLAALREGTWVPNDITLRIQKYEKWRREEILMDLGTAEVAVNDFAGALQTFLRTSSWHDAAYLAEQVLSEDELLTLARAGKLPGVDALLTHRLMRAGRFEDAAQVAGKRLRPTVERYALEQKKGHDPHLPATERAQALWTQAQMHMQLGLELFSFSPPPTIRGFDWQHGPAPTGALRSGDSWSDSVFPVTAEEKRRILQHAPKGPQYYHGRYAAAALAWEAASLMPDDTEATARLHCNAGRWLSNDPQAADRFYKALVRRNPHVALAQAADKKRWFPDAEWKFDLVLK